MSVKFSQITQGAPITNNTYQQVLGQPFMLFQNFAQDNPYGFYATKNFWFGGTVADSDFDITQTQPFLCVADFYITQIDIYTSQIFNVGEFFELNFIDLDLGHIASCQVTRGSEGLTTFHFDGAPTLPIQFNSGSSYYIEGYNGQQANDFIVYNITATAENGVY